MSSTVTALLREWQAGNAAAADELMPLIYQELRGLAARYLRHERPEHTLSPTDLVSEAYLRLSGGAQTEWNNRVHFFAIAARTMRQIFVDHARKRGASKRGANARAAPFDEQAIDTARPHELVALDDALTALAKVDERKARAIELRHFGGLTQEEIAVVLAVHVNTVASDLKFAEAWIHRELTEQR